MTRCRKKAKGTWTSRYKGVDWIPRDNSWRASISAPVKRLHLGQFKVEEDAARAYDEAAREYFGKRATLNFPKRGERSCLTALPKPAL